MVEELRTEVGHGSIDDVTDAIIKAAISTHRRLGPGLLETVYRAVLARSLQRVGLYVEEEKVVPLEIDGMLFEQAFRVDLMVARAVIVEIKSCEALDSQHARQILTFMRLSNVRVGLLMNFGAVTLKSGLRRFVNGLPAGSSSRLRVNWRGEVP